MKCIHVVKEEKALDEYIRLFSGTEPNMPYRVREGIVDRAFSADGKHDPEYSPEIVATWEWPSAADMYLTRHSEEVVDVFDAAQAHAYLLNDLYVATERVAKLETVARNRRKRVERLERLILKHGSKVLIRKMGAL